MDSATGDRQLREVELQLTFARTVVSQSRRRPLLVLNVKALLGTFDKENALLRDCETANFTKLRDPEMCAGMVVTGGRSSEAATPAEVSLEDGTQQSGGIPATNLTFSDGRKEDIMLSA